MTTRCDVETEYWSRGWSAGVFRLSAIQLDVAEDKVKRASGKPLAGPALRRAVAAALMTFLLMSGQIPTIRSAPALAVQEESPAEFSTEGLAVSARSLSVSQPASQSSPEAEAGGARAASSKISLPPTAILVCLNSAAAHALGLDSEVSPAVLARRIKSELPSLAALNQDLSEEPSEPLIPPGARKPPDLSEPAAKLRGVIERTLKVRLRAGVRLEDALARYRADPNVEYAEPDHVRYTSRTPNDPRFPEQWALQNTGQGGGLVGADIGAVKAWDVAVGEPDVVIAVIDTGVQWNHPDLEANIWTNRAEFQGRPGRDDDRNGYVDDIRGWDFVSVPPDSVSPGEDPWPPDNDPMDFAGHGTHVAGIAAAVTDNGIGIAGVSWHSKIMALRAGYVHSSGRSSTEDSAIVAAIVYAADNGAKVINMSFGAPEPSETMKTALDYASERGLILVASAGNDSCECPEFPAAFPMVIAVAASDKRDRLASFSTFGPWIDVAAPGVEILSTYRGAYALLDGTSMASPHVAGLAALIAGQHRDFTPRKIRQILRVSAKPGPTGADRWSEQFGYGRIDAAAALDVDSACEAEIEAPGFGAILSGKVEIRGTARCDQGGRYYELSWGKGRKPTDWHLIKSGPATASGESLGEWDIGEEKGDEERGEITLRLEVVDEAGRRFVDRQVRQIAVPCPGAFLGRRVPVSVSGTTRGGQNVLTPTTCSGGQGPEWPFRWTAPADGTYVISTFGSSFDTTVYVRNGTCDGEELKCNDDDVGGEKTSRLEVPLKAGQTVVVVVDGYNEDEVGDFRLDIRMQSLPAPSPTPTPTPTPRPTLTPTPTPSPTPCWNEDLGSVFPVSRSDSTTDAANRLGGGCGGGSAPDRAFGWTAPADGTYVISTFGSSFDTVVYVRDGTCDGKELACNDDVRGGDQTSLVTVPLKAGQTVVVVVDGRKGPKEASGNFVLHISCPGDCDGDGQVSIDELVKMVNIALGKKPLSNCSAGDANGDGEITIDEIVRAVKWALNGCGASTLG